MTDVENATPADLDPEHASVPAVQNVDEIVAKLMEQMAAQEAKIKQLMAERGVPADPIAAAVQALLQHVKARAAMHPRYDFSELLEQLEKLPEAVTAAHANLLRRTVGNRKYTPIRHDLDYIEQLVEDLDDEIAKKAVA